MKEFILSFDIPREMGTVRVRIFRELMKISATKVHDSFWKSDKLEDLIEIAQLVKKSGGDARILEERFVF